MVLNLNDERRLTCGIRELMASSSMHTKTGGLFAEITTM